MPTKIIKKGSILLARPSLNLDIFNRSVVIITSQSEYGCVGFILNKPTTSGISELVPDISFDATVKEGGPVENDNLYYIHTRPDLIKNSIPIHGNLFWSGNITDVMNATKNGLITKNEINFYMGYCGWGPQQLVEEIKNKEWELINEMDFDVLEDWNNNLWKNLLNKLGGINLVWSNTPSDPFMN